MLNAGILRQLLSTVGQVLVRRTMFVISAQLLLTNLASGIRGHGPYPLTYANTPYSYPPSQFDRENSHLHSHVPGSAGHCSRMRQDDHIQRFWKGGRDASHNQTVDVG